MPDTVAEPLAGPGTGDALRRTLSDGADPPPVPDDAERFGAALDRFTTACVVLLGAATQGGAGFYRARAATPEEAMP